MKQEIEILDKTLTVDWEQNANKVKATVNGKDYELTFTSPSPNVYTILLNNKVYELAIEVNPTSHTNQVKVAGEIFATKVVDHRQRNRKNDASASGIQTISAPMPGRVVQILKNEGDEVKAGEGVIVVEAMKMQNELSSAKTGRITTVKVKAGQTVSAGEILIIIE
jgi:biotin carboxyl carrier protein